MYRTSTEINFSDLCKMSDDKFFEYLKIKYKVKYVADILVKNFSIDQIDIDRILCLKD